MNLELHATPEDVMRAVDAMQDYARAQHIPENTAFGLALALEECGSNIVNHALRRDARQTFRVAFACTEDAFLIELRDRGPAFDPTASVPRGPQAADEDVPGGWGLVLVRHYTDEMRYVRDAGENVLRLTTRLRPAAGGKLETSDNAGGLKP